MKITFAICTHNEGDYIEQLLNRLQSFISISGPLGIEFETVILDDYSEDLKTKEILSKDRSMIISVYQRLLDGDYAEQKNYLKNLCHGDWILNLDADEWVTEDFLSVIPHIIDANPDIEAYWIPRINTVEGLTIKHLQKWNWVVTKFENFRKIRFIDSSCDEYKLLKDFGYIINDENGIVTYYEPIIAWPDYQMRLFKNLSSINWINKVHERLTGFEKFGMIPQEPDLAIRHFKDIARQEKQNAFYESIQHGIYASNDN